MGTKLNIEYVRSEFEKYGYTLLSEEYTHNNTKLDYICPKGHEHNITWHNWQYGYRCSFCARNVKLTIEYIKSEFDKYGCTLLSKEYIGNKNKLHYTCSKGHEHDINFNDWQQGHGCPTCYGNTKLTFEYIKDYFDKEGYTLLSKKYINYHAKLDYRCPVGHEHNVAFSNWKIGHRCVTCAIIKHTGSGSPTWKGGVSYEPYCPIWSDEEYKKDIKLRDGNKCLNPDCWKKDKMLSVHHIDYNKKSCSPKNLITVCRSCNARANFHREWHTAWYQALMYRRYKYEY